MTASANPGGSPRIICVAMQGVHQAASASTPRRGAREGGDAQEKKEHRTASRRPSPRLAALATRTIPTSSLRDCLA